MKQQLVFMCAAAILLACNSNKEKTSASGETSETKVAAMSTNELAYPVKDWAEWQPGSMENLKSALQSLKDIENGDVEASLAYFADSARLAFDQMEGTFSKDSMRKMFTAQRSMIKAMEIKMDDYESVRSKDGKQEYVSLWYSQKWQDNAGKWDSAVFMDDMKFVNGKIASIDEKMRRYPKN